MRPNEVDNTCNSQRFRVTVSYLSTVTTFNLPHLHVVPLLGVTLSEFCQDLRHQKTTVPGLSCGILCMILYLAVSVEH